MKNRTFNMAKFEREMREREKLPAYKITICCRLRNEKIVDEIMKAMAEIIYAADSIAALGWAEYNPNE